MSTNYSTSWISKGLEHFLAQIHQSGPGSCDNPVDFLIVGSGYGGSLAAAEISQQCRSASVHLFERGKEFLPGMFPTSTSDLVGQVRLCGMGRPGPQNIEGLFDVHLDDGVTSICANGLGGGSLINAAVMRRPSEKAFCHQRWPASITLGELAKYYNAAERLLGSGDVPRSPAEVNDPPVSVDDLKPPIANIFSVSKIKPSKAAFLKSHAERETHNGFRQLLTAAAGTSAKPEENKKTKEDEKNGTEKRFTYEEAALSLAVTEGPNRYKVQQAACIGCGDCATGCNHNAKNSLDSSVLFNAYQHGAKISTGATVLKVEKCVPKAPRDETRWMVHVVYTNPDLRVRDCGYQEKYPNATVALEPVVNIVYCKNVLLCAGTFGSTEILKRSNSDKLQLSPLLGDNFSTNGDMLAFCDTEHLQREHPEWQRPLSVAQLDVDADKRKIGPTICGVVSTKDEHSGAHNPDLLIEEMAVPAAMEPFLAMGVSIADTVRRISSFDFSRHTGLIDPARQNREAINHTGVYAVMGDDNAGGSLELESTENFVNPPLTDGYLRARFKPAGDLPLFKRQLAALSDLLRPKHLQGWWKTWWSPEKLRWLNPVIANPGWQLPSFLGELSEKKGGVVTVHPLGGCGMAESIDKGVVDEFGQVFNADKTSRSKLHQGLFVLDGSIIPTALAANPAITISALTLRSLKHPCAGLRMAISRVIRQQSDCKPNKPPLEETVDTIFKRPRFNDEPFRPRHPTRFDIIERMKGEIVIDNDDGSQRTKILELTLRFCPIKLNELFEHDPQQEFAKGQLSQTRLKVNEDAHGDTRVVSQIRLYDPKRYQAAIDQHNRGEPLAKHQLSGLMQCKDFQRLCREQTPLDAYLANAADITLLAGGTLDVFHRGDSHWYKRVVRFLWHNRRQIKLHKLLKGIYLWPMSKLRINPATLPVAALLSHAAEQRYMTYKLYARGVFANPDPQCNFPEELLEAIKNNQRINSERADDVEFKPLLVGKKTIQADENHNIWRQLTEMTVIEFPHLNEKKSKKPLSLQLDLLADLKIPLMRVADQSQMINSKQELVSLSTYLLRMLAPMQYPLLIEKEKRDNNRSPNRFAQALAHDLKPDKPIELVVGEVPDNRIAGLPAKTPVKIRLTRYRRQSPKPPVLLIHGYSASSSTFAHPSLNNPMVKVLHDQGFDCWVVDLRTSCAMPTAVYPWHFEDVAQIDIPKAVHHISNVTSQPKIDVIAHCMGAAMFSMAILDRGKGNPELENLHEKINKVVLSQVPPVIRLREAGRFRSFISSYMKTFIPETRYSLMPSKEPGALEVGADRLLRTLPYPEEDRKLERKRAYRNAAYQRTRRRLDLLYTRTFHLKNATPETLQCIDDLFGPLNVQTISQSIHFARKGWLTNRIGNSLQKDHNTDDALRERWTFPTYVFVGVENSLFEPGALNEFRRKAEQLKLKVQCAEPIADYGHQDAFLAKDAKEKVYDNIIAWLHSGSPTISARCTFSSSDPYPANAIRCYRSRGMRVLPKPGDTSQLQIKIHKQDLAASNFYGCPEYIGMWVEPQMYMRDSFFYCDYSHELADRQCALVACNRVKPDGDYYCVTIHAEQMHEQLLGGSAQFFFTSRYAIANAAEPQELSL